MFNIVLTLSHVFLQSKESSKPVTRVEAYVRAHTKKNGEPVNKKAAEVLVRYCRQVYISYAFSIYFGFLSEEYVF